MIRKRKRIESAENKPAAEDFGRVSRAGQKLADADKAFRADWRGKVVMDLGSSTGGFTEYALERGAAEVIAVEKGTRQMKAPLRFDPRVKLFEKADLFDFKILENGLKFPEIIVIDVSFVSMRKVLLKVARDFLSASSQDARRSDVKVLAMLKPQFEARAEQLNKGVVKNDKIRRGILKDFENWLRANGWKIVAKHDNEVAGVSGNEERFYYLARV